MLNINSKKKIFLEFPPFLQQSVQIDIEKVSIRFLTIIINNNQMNTFRSDVLPSSLTW